MNNREFTCRVCRLEDRSMEMISLRDKDNWEKFVKITSVKVFIHDTFPQQICKNCNNTMDLCVNFIDKSHESDRLFRKEESARESRNGMAETEEDPWQFLYIDDDDNKSVASLPSDDSKIANEKDKEITDKSDKLAESPGPLCADKVARLQSVENLPDIEVNKGKGKVATIAVHSKSFKCPQCELTFPTITQLGNHKTTMHFKLCCNTCNEVFYQLKSWNKHIHQIHPQVFECEVCKMTFTKRSHYRAHNLQHLRNNNQGQVSVAIPHNYLQAPELTRPIRPNFWPITPYMRPIRPRGQAMSFHQPPGPQQPGNPHLIQCGFVPLPLLNPNYPRNF